MEGIRAFREVCSGSQSLTGDDHLYYEESLILKARPSNKKDDWVLVFNKRNKTRFMRTYYRLMITCVSDDCFVPHFVTQMNDTLFAQIDGVVDFNFTGSKGGKSGWFVLFNIDDRPMGCFTFEGEDLSPEVRHKVLLFY